MAATKTTYIPVDTWMPWAQEAMVNTNVILASGAVEIDNGVSGLSGEFFSAPYQQSLDNAGAVTQIVADTTAVTPEAMLDYKIITPIAFYSAAFTSGQYTSLARGGGDPIQQFGTQLGTYIGKQKQNKLIEVIKAQFKSGGALANSDHQLNPSTTLNSGVLFDAQALFGENSGELTTAFINSKVLAKFKQTYAMVEFPLSEITNNILSTGNLQRWAGINFVVNDTLCAIDTNGDYPIYLCGGDPFYLGEVMPLTEGSIFDPLTGGGTWKYAYSFKIAPAVKGISYTSATLPATDALLGTAASFTLKWDSQNVKLVQINVPLSV